eukprot:CAMPEP_0175542732 /NCGR_PEP_ID=MMETSP0096-20121207/27916_1 /TAXON_ID=311494 /ORGANISM="Alexandrium monilatum, Strain CCMP3105" /LENGTH=81 /DNA_ID=CAMNT_0016845669 /DNA_START=373 /DNA_END=615 /DNA_ORIENTATION=-
MSLMEAAPFSNLTPSAQYSFLSSCRLTSATVLSESSGFSAPSVHPAQADPMAAKISQGSSASDSCRRGTQTVGTPGPLELE